MLVRSIVKVLVRPYCPIGSDARSFGRQGTRAPALPDWDERAVDKLKKFLAQKKNGKIPGSEKKNLKTEKIGKRVRTEIVLGKLFWELIGTKFPKYLLHEKNSN